MSKKTEAINPYTPPQATECRGPCGDSGCPHKPSAKKPWWAELTEFFVLMAGLAIVLLAIGFAAPLIAEAIRKYKNG